jgi:hypothetical protein
VYINFISVSFLPVIIAKMVTPTTSFDSAIKAIDPKGTISDTSQYPVDSSRGIQAILG